MTAGTGFVLIDSSKPEKRAELEGALTRAGCVPGTLNLIVLTHGDYDHAGNAAYLREKYKTRIAMHRDDSERVERGDWSLNMKPKPDKFGLLFRVVSLFIRPGPFDTFTPDLDIEEGRALSEYGLDATVLHLPGHTKGSIGVLTGGGDLFCGDLFDSMMDKPSFEFFIDDMVAARLSLQRLQALDVRLVIPATASPFDWTRSTEGAELARGTRLLKRGLIDHVGHGECPADADGSRTTTAVSRGRRAA